MELSEEEENDASTQNGASTKLKKGMIFQNIMQRYKWYNFVFVILTDLKFQSIDDVE